MNIPSPGEPTRELHQALSSALGSYAMAAVEMHAFCEALLTRHHSAIRLRPGRRSASLSFPTEPIPWYSLGHRSSDPGVRPSRMLDYAAGEYFLQDAGSMLALAACGADDPPRSDRLVCDLCAAPGGKASALLESIGNGFLLANEPIQSRVAPLAYNLARTGSDRYCISSLDPETLANRLGGIFDLVLVDVPCSGQALLGKRKQALSAVSSMQIEHSAQRARRILAAALDLVRPGGGLVLSTCTFAEAENEAQVRWLLGREGVEPAPVDTLSDYRSSDLESTYRLWPHRHGCAGSFAASLTCHRQAKRGAEPRRPKKQRERPQRRHSQRLQLQRERPPEELERCFENTPHCVQVAGAVCWTWPDDAPDWVGSVAISGPELAYRTGQTWKPSHEAALRRDAALQPNRVVDVDDESAWQFLRGEPIACEASGWCVVRHQGRSLGWVKASRGIGKNHLPAAARVKW